MKRIRLRAFAKVNYALEVLGVRADGYHEISTVFQSVSLADDVELERTTGGFELRVEPASAGTGPPEANTARKAWAALCDIVGEELPVRVHLGKRIPAGAGLGGASADAAAVLAGLNELFELGLGPEALREAGLRVGADVPFCISGGTALAGGVGEVLSPLPAPPAHHLVLLKPAAGANTGEVYRRYDEKPSRNTSCVAPVVAALEAGDLAALSRSVGNALAPVTKKLVPEVGEYESELLRSGALGASMTGSGTAVVGIFEDEAAACRALEAAAQSPTSFAGVCEPAGRGVELL